MGDVGLRAAAASGLAVDVGAFVRRADNLIDWVKPPSAPPTAIWRATNVGGATYHGVEGTLSLPAWHGLE